MGSSSNVGNGLARRRLSAVHIFFFTVAASAPLTVLGGGVTTTFAVTGAVGIPLSYLLIALALAFFAVGYAAMSRYVSNAGAFYAYLANGLGRSWGVAGSFVALIAYNAMQVGLYGLFGSVFGDFLHSKFPSIDLPWWAWALMAIALVAVLGVLRVDLNATILAVLLLLEIFVTALFDIGAFLHPAGGTIAADGLAPTNLFGSNVIGALGIVFALGIAAFTGFESGAIYSEECKDPRRTVGRATFAAVAFTGLFYTLSSWALTVAAGPDQVVAQSKEQGPGILFGLLTQQWGSFVADVANVLFFTSIFAALLSFHNGVSRYLFALGRERVLPARLGRTGVASGAPVAGSVIQTTIALLIVLTFAIAGGDPVLELFTWLTTMGAAGILLLMIGTSIAVIGFFSQRKTEESLWQRLIAPLIATISLTAMMWFTLDNFGALLGPNQPSYLRWALLLLLGAAVVGGVAWGEVIKRIRPVEYQLIGHGALEPSAEDAEMIPIG